MYKVINEGEQLESSSLEDIIALIAGKKDTHNVTISIEKIHDPSEESQLFAERVVTFFNESPQDITHLIDGIEYWESASQNSTGHLTSASVGITLQLPNREEELVIEMTLLTEYLPSDKSGVREKKEVLRETNLRNESGETLRKRAANLAPWSPVMSEWSPVIGERVSLTPTEALQRLGVEDASIYKSLLFYLENWMIGRTRFLSELYMDLVPGEEEMRGWQKTSSSFGNNHVWRREKQLDYRGDYHEGPKLEMSIHLDDYDWVESQMVRGECYIDEYCVINTCLEVNMFSPLGISPIVSMRELLEREVEICLQKFLGLIKEA